MPQGRTNVLIGWQEIADYMGCSLNTARRRESEGLPVFRTGRLVHAYPEDIDNWLKNLRYKGGNVDAAVVEGTHIVDNANELSAVLSEIISGNKDERVALIRFGSNSDEFESVKYELKSALDKYRNLIETIPEWVWEMNRHGEFVYSSPRVFDIVGYYPQEVLGYHPNEFLTYDDDKDGFSNMIDDMGLQKRIVDQFICRVHHRDGSLLTMETSARPMYNKEGNLFGFSGISRDVTTRVRAEKALRASRNFLDQVINGIFEEVLIVDHDYKIIKVNTYFELAHKMKAREVTGKNCYSVKYGFRKPCHEMGKECPIRKVFAEVAPVKQERQNTSEDGKTITVDIYAFPVFDGDGNVEAVTQISRILQK